MSLKSKIEAVIYAAEDPVTLQQLVGLLGQEAQAELDAADALQGQLALREAEPVLLLEEVEAGDPDALNAETLGIEDFVGVEAAEELGEIPEEGSGAGIATAHGEQSVAAELTAEESTEVRTEEPREELAAEAMPGSASEGEFAPDAEGQPIAEAGDAEQPSAAETRARERRLREYVRSVLDALVAEYRDNDRGLEVREVAGGFRFATKPEYHDAVRGFVRSLKPPLKLSLQALETLAVVAYKQPVTAPEVGEIRGVDSGGVLGSLMTRKLVTTAGRKQVIGRPILYKTTKEFLLRFGLKDLSELPSIEEFERLASNLNEAVQEEIPMRETPIVPVGMAVESGPLSPEEVAREVEPSRGIHRAQADGDPNASEEWQGSPDEVSAEYLTPAPDGPGEFTGDENVPPADNLIDGRISGVPPTYDTGNDELAGSPANDARIQSEQQANAGSDD